MKNTQAAFTPKPILNWLDEREYHFEKRMSLQQWAWEFLRRNPLYQADYADLRAIIDEAAANGEHEDDWRRVYDPPKRDDETENEYITRVGGKYSSMSISSWYEKKWKLSGSFLPDPFKEYNEQCYLIRFISSPMVHIITEHWEGFKSVSATGSVFDKVQNAVVFDLSMPIDPQIKAASAYLIRQRKRLIGKGIIEKWPCKNAALQSYPQYLRLLDAQLPNARTAKEIAEAIKDKKKGRAEFNPSNSIAKSLAKALEIRDRHYWAIPMLGKKQRKEFS